MGDKPELALERLCDHLDRTNPQAVYEPLDEVATGPVPEACVLLWAEAVTELEELGYRVPMPRVTCPECGSEAIDFSSDDPAPGDVTFGCTECGHTWTGAS